MKKLAFLISIFSLNICVAQHKADSTIFKEYLLKNELDFTFDGQKPMGKGWDLIEDQFKKNQFVAWGEYHNSNLFSKLTSYTLSIAAQNGFKNWVVETSPFVASELTRFSKTKVPFDSILSNSKSHPTYGTFPFFKTKEDAEMLEAANKNKIKIWGIDQEYQMAFTYCFDKIYNAQTLTIKQNYKAVYDSLTAKWWMPKIKLLDSLKNAIPQKNFKNALDNIKISREIYRNDDNQLRAKLMKDNFYKYYDQTPTKNEKVFFKMGANHLAKGVNLTTHIFDIGNAIYELAERNQSKFTNVLFVLRYSTEKGKIIDDLVEEKREYPIEFLKLYDSKKWIVVDVRNLIYDFYFDNTLSNEAYQIMEKYDFVVVSPEIKE
jgi:hypothetical protein